MKHLIEIINEGNIDRCERKYREFTGMCKAYCPDIDMKDVCVKKTSKNNWAVYGKCGDECKKLFIASYFVLDDDVIKNKGIEVCTESLNESKEFEYTAKILQYDPDLLKEFKNGNASEEELNDLDNLISGDYEDIKVYAKNPKDAKTKILNELYRLAKKHEDICAAEIHIEPDSQYERGKIIDTIYV